MGEGPPRGQTVAISPRRCSRTVSTHTRGYPDNTLTQVVAGSSILMTGAARPKNKPARTAVHPRR